MHAIEKNAGNQLFNVLQVIILKKWSETSKNPQKITTLWYFTNSISIKYKPFYHDDSQCKSFYSAAAEGQKIKQMPPYQHLECFLSAKERTLIQLRKSYIAAS